MKTFKVILRKDGYTSTVYICAEDSIRARRRVEESYPGYEIISLYLNN